MFMLQIFYIYIKKIHRNLDLENDIDDVRIVEELMHEFFCCCKLAVG